MRTHLSLLIAFGLVLYFSTPALAASAPSGAVFGGYFDDFVAYWKEKIKHQNSMVLGVLLVGAIGILIIMTSKKGRK